MKRIISGILIFLLVLTSIPTVVFAAEPTYSGILGQNISWTITDGTLYLDGSGEMPNFEGATSATNRNPWESLSQYINNIYIGDGITSIGEYAFYNLKYATNVRIPNSVTSIGSFAFCNCLYLTQVRLPNSVKSIGYAAFEYCRRLKNITIPYGVTSIEGSTFYQCYNLTNVNIPTSVTLIGDFAFGYCHGLQHVNIPFGVTNISDYTFIGCSGLVSIGLPKGINSIGYRAFKDCANLADIHYSGSSAECSKITIGSYNDTFKNANKHHDVSINQLKFKEDICFLGIGETITFSVSKEELSLVNGEYITSNSVGVNSTDLTWTTDTTNVARISSDGSLTGLEEGWCRISVYTNDPLTYGTYCIVYVGNVAEYEDLIKSKDFFVQQHIDFINSTTYQTVTTDYRYADILWNNYYGSQGQANAELVYDIMEGFFEAISFSEISSLENPYDAILLDLLSSKNIETSLSSTVDSSIAFVIEDVVGNLVTLMQGDEEWAQGDIVGNFKNLLATEPSDYSSNKLYQALSQSFNGKSKSATELLFINYDCFDKVFSNISDAAEGVDYFLELLRYIAAIEAYYNASEEFKTILKEVSEVMPTVNEHYGGKFNETYQQYSSCVDYDSIVQVVLEHAVEEGFWLVTGFMSDVLQDSALTFCKTALGLSESAASTLVASLWAAKTGFNLANAITENDTLVNCRRMLRANYMLDEAVYRVMQNHAATLTSNPCYEEAAYFDESFNLYKNVQLNSLRHHQTYMSANGSSFINFLGNNQERFNREVQAKAVIIHTWKNISCHSNVVYTLANTIVVACPTNVYVYNKDDGTLVASVVDDNVYSIDDALTVVAKSNEKAICVPNLNDYKIVIEATDEGKMSVDYTINSSENNHYERAVVFDEIDLTISSEFELCVDEDTNKMTLQNENSGVILPDLDTFDLNFTSASLTLQDDLVLNYKVDEALFTEAGYTNPYVVFSLNGEDIRVAEYRIENAKYIFDFENIVPHQMNDTIYATLYATYNGVEYASGTCEYSVATYCYNMLEKYNTDDYAKLRTLLVDLLNYGAASQVYMNYNIEELVTSSLTEEQKAWGTSTDRTLETVQELEYKTIDNPTVQWKSGGLNLQKSVGMRFKISAENIENLTVKVANDSGKEMIITSEQFEATEGGYYVFFEGMNAGQMSDIVYLTVYNGETAVSNTIRYSIESYAYAQQNSTDVNLVELVKAMMKYGDSAKAYIS